MKATLLAVMAVLCSSVRLSAAYRATGLQVYFNTGDRGARTVPLNTVK